MKKIITLCLMLVFANVAMSQGKSTASEKATKMTNDWATRLSMTADQKTKTYDVLVVKIEDRMKIVDQFKVDGDAAAKSAGLTRVREELKKEMKLILKDGQKYQQWEAMTDQSADNRK